MDKDTNKGRWPRRLLLASLLLIVSGSVLVGSAVAQGEGGVNEGTGFLAIGAGLAVGLAGVGTGLAQGHAGAAAIGATAEDSKNFGKAIVFVALPETVVLFGFVIAFLLMQLVTTGG